MLESVAQRPKRQNGQDDGRGAAEQSGLVVIPAQKHSGHERAKAEIRSVRRRGASHHFFPLNGPGREHQHAAWRQQAGEKPKCRERAFHVSFRRVYARRLDRPPAKEQHHGDCPSGDGKPQRRLFD